ncbi:hypothetical protein [Paenibacillus lemnae]|uniref:DUF2325 domain-containing protein n=1 Tax=Paenibacillus lemnae TaxID=1330551 RepID=A0A848M8X4_PAELE|nr:hypothetical protein [Paenibacillus lemnae]NMO96709.1 hypothetical protein [Paenibacillus lemnae]
MKNKWAGRLIGFMADDDIKIEQGDRFKSVMMKQMSEPFPYRQLGLLLTELSDRQKRLLTDILNIKIKAPSDQPFPDATLIQLLRLRIAKGQNKAKAIQAIFTIILPLFKDADHITAEEHLTAESHWVQEYGKWHYYWSLRFFPDEHEAIQQRLHEMDAEQVDPVKKHPDLQSAASLIASTRESIEPAKEKAEPVKDKEKALVARERDLRQKAELESERLRKQIKELEKSHQRLSHEHHDLESQYREQHKKLRELEEQYDSEKKRVYSLERAKVQVEGELRHSSRMIQQLQHNEQNLKAQSDELVLQLKTKVKSLEHEKKSPPKPAAALQHITDILHADAERYFAVLREKQELEGKDDIRKRISDSMLLVNALESYFQKMDDIVSPAFPQSPAPAAHQPELEKETPTPDPLKDKVTEGAEESPKSQEERNDHYSGTFYRRDHGGYIVLENHETFNITESMVNSIGLEHEAEVQCDPQQREDGSSSYYIRLLLQGDDARAPIQQFMGYVELGEHFTYYCVDMNNPELRFPIHEKDVAMQEPKDGDPCLFNVAIDGRYARLSKLFGSTEMQHTESSLKIKSTTRPKVTKHEETNRYLEGCTIVIIGGLAKWFESVVTETGAALVHDTGRNPDRVHPHLRRANALFMLLTANSHEATVSCVPIAKEHGVPHFKIEGSKSNLRKQLWDNRELIRNRPSHVQ